MNLNSMHRAILIAMFATVFPTASFAGFFGIGIGVNVGFAPPPLPVYTQPPCPSPGFIWTPGYWAYAADDEDYYWVPGTWVMAPSPGLLWTPGYWAEVGGGYAWNEGYWGPQVGFYGGIDYGFGYFGVGFTGGYWRGSNFFYNRSVTNVSNVNITNVYNRTVNNNFYGNRASFNGVDGVPGAPTHRDLVAARLRHYGPIAPQRAQAASARSLPTSFASNNHGHPPIAATQRPGSFHGGGVMAANGVHGSMAPARGNREQSSPTAEHSFASGPHGLQPSRVAQRPGGYQAARNHQTAQSYPAQRGYQSQNVATRSGDRAARTDQAPRSYGVYQVPRSYPASHDYRSYQAPRNEQAPRSYGAYQATRSYQPPRGYHAYQAPRSNQSPHDYRAYQAPRNR